MTRQPATPWTSHQGGYLGSQRRTPHPNRGLFSVRDGEIPTVTDPGGATPQATHLPPMGAAQPATGRSLLDVQGAKNG